MTDLTILFYTANLISDHFAQEIRRSLVETTEGMIPLISVSQKPIQFGQNICVGQIGVSNYNVYKQILIGATAANTEYIACCEDDSLYVPEYFTFRPPVGTFAYNLNRWSITKNPPNPIYFWRDRMVMGQCIVARKTLVETLTRRYNKFPDYNPNKMKYWGEPGRCEHWLDLPSVPFLTFRTKEPTVAFKHRLGLSGVRNRRPTDIIVDELEPWGKASELWKKVHENS